MWCTIISSRVPSPGQDTRDFWLGSNRRALSTSKTGLLRAGKEMTFSYTKWVEEALAEGLVQPDLNKIPLEKKFDIKERKLFNVVSSVDKFDHVEIFLVVCGNSCHHNISRHHILSRHRRPFCLSRRSFRQPTSTGVKEYELLDHYCSQNRISLASLRRNQNLPLRIAGVRGGRHLFGFEEIK